MNGIQCCSISNPIFCKKVVDCTVQCLAVSLFAIFFIGLIASQGSTVRAIVQCCFIPNAVLLAFSLFLKSELKIHENSLVRIDSTDTIDSWTDPPDGPDPFEKLPLDIRLEIFCYLNTQNLLKFRLVCKNWKNFLHNDKLWTSVNLHTVFQNLQVFDGNDWKSSYFELTSLGIKTDAESEIDKLSQIIALQNLLLKLKEERNAVAMLFTIPKGLTLNKLVMLRCQTGVGKYDDSFKISSNPLWDSEVSKTYKIVITDDVFVGNNLSTTKRSQLMEKLGCQLPKIIEAAAFMMVGAKKGYGRFSEIVCLDQLNKSCVLCMEGNSFFSIKEASENNHINVSRWKFNVVDKYIINIS